VQRLVLLLVLVLLWLHLVRRRIEQNPSSVSSTLVASRPAAIKVFGEAFPIGRGVFIVLATGKCGPISKVDHLIVVILFLSSSATA
jgi:hypothetical protein